MITWSKDTRQFHTGLIGGIGRVKIIFSVWWGTTKDTDGPWRLGCDLPGVKNSLGSFMTEEDAMARAEVVWSNWKKWLNLKEEM